MKTLRVRYTSTAALKLSQYRPLMKKLKGEDLDKYKELFGGKWRLQIPFESEGTLEALDVPEDVGQYLTTQGIPLETIDYRRGVFSRGHNTVKIGKVLKDAPALLKKFNERLSGNIKRDGQTGVLIILSRHPYDIIGQSTDRDWTSCKNLLKGSNKNYLVPEIKAGVLVAYVVNKDDTNIKKPLARALIVPYRSKDLQHTKLIVSGTYGQDVPGFLDTVQAWLDHHLPAQARIKYHLDKKVYDDDLQESVYEYGSLKDPTEELITEIVNNRDHNLLKRMDLSVWPTERILALVENKVVSRDRFYYLLAGLKTNRDPKILDTALKGNILALQYIRKNELTTEHLKRAIDSDVDALLIFRAFPLAMISDEDFGSLLSYDNWDMKELSAIPGVMNRVITKHADVILKQMPSYSEKSIKALPKEFYTVNADKVNDLVITSYGKRRTDDFIGNLCSLPSDTFRFSEKTLAFLSNKEDSSITYYLIDGGYLDEEKAYDLALKAVDSDQETLELVFKKYPPSETKIESLLEQAMVLDKATKTLTVKKPNGRTYTKQSKTQSLFDCIPDQAFKQISQQMWTRVLQSNPALIRAFFRKDAKHPAKLVTEMINVISEAPLTKRALGTVLSNLKPGKTNDPLISALLKNNLKTIIEALT